MLWLFLALLSAMCEATKDYLSKRSMRKVDEYVAAWALLALTLPFLLPLLLVVPIPPLDDTFWYATAAFSAIFIVATVLFMKAIRRAYLSLTVPMTAFTPAFMLLTSPLLLGEFPTAMGILGIALVVIGAYLLNASEARRGVLEPVAALLRERGPALMLAVAFLWSLTATLGKLAVEHSSPVFYLIVAYAMTGSAFTLFILLRKRGRLWEVRPHLPQLAAVGLVVAISEVSLMYAFTLTLAAFAIAVKRTSIFFSSLYGFAFFSETHMAERLAGVLIMLAGVAVMAVS